MEVIEAGFVIIVIATVADWVHMGNVIRVSLQRQDCAGRAFYRSHFPPGVILVGGDQGGIVGLGRAIIVASVDRHYITLQVLGVIVMGEAGVPGVFHPYAYNRALFIVQEHQRAGKGAVRLILHLRQERGTHPVIVRICAIGVGLPGAQTIGIIRIPGGFCARFGDCQPVAAVHNNRLNNCRFSYSDLNVKFLKIVILSIILLDDLVILLVIGNSKDFKQISGGVVLII